MGRRNDIDWSAIQRDFRIGQFSLRQIAANHGVNHGSIGRRAVKEGWVQDKSEEVRERTRAALITKETESATQNSTQSTPTPADIDAAVHTNVALVREHRADIREGREVAKSLMQELREGTDNRAEIEQTIGDETRDDKTVERRNRMLRAVALPMRATTLVSLANANKTFIALERQAFNLSPDPTEGAAAADTPRVIEWVIVDPKDASAAESENGNG